MIFAESNSFIKSRDRKPKITTGIVPKIRGIKYVFRIGFFPISALRMSMISFQKYTIKVRRLPACRATFNENVKLVQLKSCENR